MTVALLFHGWCRPKTRSTFHQIRVTAPAPGRLVWCCWWCLSPGDDFGNAFLIDYFSLFDVERENLPFFWFFFNCLFDYCCSSRLSCWKSVMRCAFDLDPQGGAVQKNDPFLHISSVLFQDSGGRGYSSVMVSIVVYSILPHPSRFFLRRRFIILGIRLARLRSFESERVVHPRRSACRASPRAAGPEAL